MASQNDQLVEQLIAALKKGGSSGGFSSSGIQDSKSSKDRVRATTLTKAEQNQQAFYKEFLKVQKEDSSNTQTLQEQLKYSNSLFGKTIDGAKDMRQLEKTLPSAFQTAFSKSGSVFVQAMSESVSNMEGVFEAQMKIEKMPAVIELMTEFSKGTKTLGELNKGIEELGYTAEEQAAILGRVNASMVDENGIRQENIHTTADLKEEMKRLASDAGAASEALGKVSYETGPNRFGGALSKMVPMAKMLGLELVNATKAAAKYGTTLQMVDSRMMGLNPEELAQLQSNNRQSMLALGGDTEEYNEIIKGNSASMLRFTGDLGAASRATAHIITTSRMLGDANVDTSKFLKQQTATFGKFNRVLGMTSEQFGELSTTLIGDTDIRKNLLRMDKTKRVQAFQDIQNTYEKLRLDGLQHEQAVALVKQMRGVQAKDAKTRIGEGARISSILGSMGMGKEGEYVRQIMEKGARATTEELQKKTDIMIAANKKIAKAEGSGTNQELVIQGMIAASNLGSELGADSAYADAALAEGAAAKDGAEAKMAQDKIFGKHMGFVEDHWTKFMMGFDTLASFMQGPFFAAIAAAGLAKVAKGGIAGMGAEVSRGTGSGAGGVGKFGKGVGAAGGLVAAAAVGWQIGSYINDQLLSDDKKSWIGENIAGPIGDLFFGKTDKEKADTAANKAKVDEMIERKQVEHRKLLALEKAARLQKEALEETRKQTEQQAVIGKDQTKAMGDTGFQTNPNF